MVNVIWLDLLIILWLSFFVFFFRHFLSFVKSICGKCALICSRKKITKIAYCKWGNSRLTFCLPFDFYPRYRSYFVLYSNWHNSMDLVAIWWWTYVNHRDANDGVMIQRQDAYDDDLAVILILLSPTTFTREEKER